MAFTLLPCKKDVCQECAVKHEPDQPHNAQSMYYQYKFYGEKGRWPTWADAIAHCSDEVKKLWITALKKEGVWKREWELPVAQVPDVMPSEDGTIGSVTVVPIKYPKAKKKAGIK